MFVNLRKEVLDKEGKVVFRNAISLTLSTTTPEVIDYFVKQGYSIIDYSAERRA